MKKFAYVVDGRVHEIIPEINPDLPGFTIAQRYSAEFVEKLIEIPEGTPVEANWLYDEVNGFTEPVVPEVEEVTEDA